MSALTTQQAAELTGKNRTTIWRACKNGKVSAHRSDEGDFLIEPVELERVYGSLRSPQPADALHEDAEQPDSQPSASTFETSMLQREVALLREQLRSLESDKEDLRGERDRLLKVIEEQSASVRLLTDERAAATAKKPTSWLGRLFASQ
jgi:hypothetical protein